VTPRGIFRRASTEGMGVRLKSGGKRHIVFQSNAQGGLGGVFQFEIRSSFRGTQKNDLKLRALTCHARSY